MAAKKILFSKTRGKKIAVINADDPHYENFLVDKNHNITLGNNGDLKIMDIELTNLDTKFSFSYKNKTYHTTINLVGRYNVYNYLTALLLVHNLGFSIKNILKLNDKLTPPPGRMDMIKFNTNSIFVDYAHTPDAVENVINSAKEYKKGKIYTILGCGGDRDRTKRPIMGNLATLHSDYVILTNDNPRTEDEKQIMNDILAGVKKDNYEVIFNRSEAIKKGISLLKENDILLILGKGHEDYQIIGHDKIHFSDKEIVLENI
jgi:UDP-N-acetylmuramoyl-L-alanyl-D-glutamate--2,6-diaminopimelate ligase